MKIAEEEEEKIKKFKRFLNRLLDFFTSDLSEKIIRFAENNCEIEQEQDGFIKIVLKHANNYSVVAES
jgi:hypothetical protein